MNIIKSNLIGLGIVAVAGFLACDEDSPPPVDPGNPVDTVAYYVDEGTRADPIDITGLTPCDGQVSKNGNSYYRVTGVTPDEIYSITLTLGDGLPYQVVPDAAAAGEIPCGLGNETLGAVIDCAMRASAGGVLDFYVRGDTTVGGAFEMSYTVGGVINEGNSGTPVEVSSFPFSGGALIRSFYLLTGLTPGAAYACEFTDASGPVTLSVFPDNTYGSRQDICWTLNGSGKSCNITADASGYIYLRTQAFNLQFSVTYTISVTGASIANEGSWEEPIDITGQLPYSGMVHLDRSCYILTGLTPGSPYTVSLSNATDITNLILYGPGWAVREYDCYCGWNDGDGTRIECVAVADNRGELHVQARGTQSANGATFDLDMVPGGIPNQGNYSKPIDITGLTPWSGSVFEGMSYYRITGKAPATNYTIRITDLTDDLWLAVYDGMTYQNRLCDKNYPGTQDEFCVVQTTTGEFIIRVGLANYDVRGVTFTLDVTP